MSWADYDEKTGCYTITQAPDCTNVSIQCDLVNVLWKHFGNKAVILMGIPTDYGRSYSFAVMEPGDGPAEHRIYYTLDLQVVRHDLDDVDGV